MSKKGGKTFEHQDKRRQNQTVSVEGKKSVEEKKEEPQDDVAISKKGGKAFKHQDKRRQNQTVSVEDKKGGAIG